MARRRSSYHFVMPQVEGKARPRTRGQHTLYVLAPHNTRNTPWDNDFLQTDSYNRSFPDSIACPRASVRIPQTHASHRTPRASLTTWLPRSCGRMYHTKCSKQASPPPGGAVTTTWLVSRIHVPRHLRACFGPCTPCVVRGYIRIGLLFVPRTRGNRLAHVKHTGAPVSSRVVCFMCWRKHRRSIESDASGAPLRIAVARLSL